MNPFVAKSLNALTSLFDREKRPGKRARIELPDAYSAVYAIGDVHGCLDLLVALEEKISADAAGLSGDKLIVMLGDYVDRGPRSAEVLDHVSGEPAAPFSRVCLAGNHEECMLDFLFAPRIDHHWLSLGGLETLVSYGLLPTDIDRHASSQKRLQELVRSFVPEEHRTFLEALPILGQWRRHVFVHAGLALNVTLADQRDTDLLWIRDDFTSDYSAFGKVIVHGHTPLRVPMASAHRIAIDTGAFATGRLCAARLVPDEEPFFLFAGSPPSA